MEAKKAETCELETREKCFDLGRAFVERALRKRLIILVG